MRLRLAARVASMFGPVVLGSACGSSPSGSGNPSTTPGVAVTPTSFALTAGGQTTTLTASVTRNGVADPAATIQWSSDNLAVATVAGSGTGAVVTSVAAGTAVITARSGAASATSVVTVNLAPVPVIALSAGSTTIAPGANGSITVNVTRTAFTAPVTLALLNPPAGVGGTFSAPVPNASGETQSLTLSVGAQVQSGAYTITIRGSGTGVAAAVTTFVLTVAGGTSISWPFCAASGIPLWVAVQDGAGIWAPLTAFSSTYTFSLSSGRGGVAYAYAAGGLTFVSTFFGTTAELAAHGQELCPGSNGAFTNHSATVAGAGASDYLTGSMGRALGAFSTGGVRTAAFVGVQGTAPSATTDLFATRSTFTSPGGVLTATLQNVIMRRGIPAGTAPATLDFGAAEAFAPVTRTLTVQNLGADWSYLFGSYQTANNAYGVYFANALQLPLAQMPFPAIPAARQSAGDLHVLRLSARPFGDTLQTRYVYDVFKDAQDRTLTFGPPMSVPTVAAVRNGQNVGVTITVPVQPEYNRYFNAVASQASNNVLHYMQQTDAYAPPGSTVALQMPDFSGVAGFRPEWALKANVPSWWVTSASGWTGRGPMSPPYDLVNTPPYVDGITYVAAGRQGPFVP